VHGRLLRGRGTAVDADVDGVHVVAVVVGEPPGAVGLRVDDLLGELRGEPVVEGLGAVVVEGVGTVRGHVPGVERVLPGRALHRLAVLELHRRSQVGGVGLVVVVGHAGAYPAAPPTTRVPDVV
jgi:hypothetical protein